MQTHTIFASARRADTEQSGRSMIEMLAVLAIVGVLSVGGLAGYTVAMDRFKTTKAQEELQTVVNATRTLYANQNTYVGANWNLVFDAGGIPNNMDSATDNQGQHAFGAGITVAPAQNGAAVANGAFAVTFAEIPADACRALVTMNWGANDIVSISVGGTAVTLPADVAAANTACGTAAADIVWTFN